MVVALRDNVFPEQIGVLLLSKGAEGVTLTVTDSIPAGPAQPNTVAVTE